MSEQAVAYSPEEAAQPEGAATSPSSLSESPTSAEACSSTSHSFSSSAATPSIESPSTTHATPSSQIAPSLASLESSTLHEAPHDASLLDLHTQSISDQPSSVVDSSTDASVLPLNYPAPAASTSVTSPESAPTTGGYTDGEGQQSLSPHHQHQHQLHEQQLQDQQLHNLQDLAYDPHLLDFNSHHTFHSHPDAQSTSADVLSLDHQLHQHQHQHHHHHQQLQQHQHQHHHLHQQHQHQVDSSGHHHQQHHHAALASAIAAATSGSLTGDSLAGLAAHFQAGSHQHALPSLPPPLPTFAPMPHHHHHHHDDGSGLPAVMVDSDSMASSHSHSHGGGDSGSGAYAHLQPPPPQRQHTQVQLPPAAPLYCLCQQPYDGSCFMLACDHCNKWFHGKCVGITEESARRGEHSTYVCPSCVRSGGVGSHDHGAAGDMDIAEGHVGESGALPATSSTESTTTTATATTGSTSTGEKRSREHGGGGGDEEESGLGSGEVMVLRDEGMAGSIGGIDGGGDGGGGEPTKKRRKTQMHQRGERLCRFPGCDKKITCRSYCPRHQKQKERCSKRGTLFSTSSSPRRKSVLIGRPSKIFSQTRNQRQKLKRFDEKINEFAGGEQEGTAMLEKYLNSSYGQKRLPSTKGDKMAQHIGQNAIQLINQLPPTSPLRKPLIKALGLGLSQSEIADTFHVSRKTVERSFALPSEENLLFSLVSRPRGMKAKSSADVPTLDAPLQVQLQQAGLYPPPPSDQATAEHLEMDLGHSLPPSFTVEENGHISVSVTTRRSAEEDDEDNDNDDGEEDDEGEAMVGHGDPASGPGESVQTHVLLQGNVVPGASSMMDEVDTTPLVFQGITGE